MTGRAIAWAALTLVWIAAPSVRAQEPKACADGRPPRGTLGIEDTRCSSGQCVRGFAWEEGRLIMTFTTEPRVERLEPPAEGVLEPGDVIVSVDDKLSTTSEAARRLARVEPGDRVRLRIRREGAEREVTITAAPTCDRMRRRVFALDSEGARRWGEAMERLGEHLESFDWEGLAHPLGEGELHRLEGRLKDFDWEKFSRAWEGFEPGDLDFDLHLDTLDFHFDFDRRVQPPYELGLELTCGFFCGWRKGPDDAPVWRGQHPPKVARVVEDGPADRAGIHVGDVLLLLDGHSFVGEEGGLALGRLRPGTALTLQYLKAGETLTTTTITPRAPSPR